MRSLVSISVLLTCTALAAAPPELDQRPADDSQWGYRPADGAVSAVNPPGFCWRPQDGIVSWELECGRGGDFEKIEYHADAVALNVHCPPRTFPPGEYTWHYRGTNAEGNTTAWSRPRAFSIGESAVAMPMPSRKDLLQRIPKSHPRLFVRPEDLPRLRQLAQGPMKARFENLVEQCERLLKHPPPTAEPPTYPAGTVSHSEPWRKIWWGNRTYTIAALDGAATLGFARLLGGKEQYGQLAVRILMDCAAWDPHGATGYRYNDEAGMPYAYYFSRTYSYVHDLLNEEQRETCRRVMQIRGDEMYRHLCPRHLWRPYSSHSNRAWHFLGEVGIAFHGEIPAADDWTWFAMNVFFNVYPVWSDDDGGWHEGAGYWSSYVGRFTWWADVMRSAVGINAYEKPYFASVGYYPMYLMPPGKTGGGLGDLVARRTARANVPLASQLAAQSGNGHWQWYVEQMGGPKDAGGYVGFVRGALPRVEPVAPDDLPCSRLFRGIGQAYLNTRLDDAGKSVQVVFKSSPFGTQSHGYEANNSFLLWAYGQRLLIRSGYRDIYGSDHHRNWMWSTRSVNNITVGGRGQGKRTASALGRITAFRTTPAIDVVVGEAGEAYDVLDRFTRAVIFVKPELIVVYDRLAAKEASTFEYWLHATKRFEVADQRNVQLRVGDVGCSISLLAPDRLTFAQTDQYDPNPRPRITLREWHLTATTPQKSKTTEFVAIYRPHRVGAEVPRDVELTGSPGAYVLKAALLAGESVELRLPKAEGPIVVRRYEADGGMNQVLELAP
ncbi:MAG: DUF4962 domain-containing protein [Candidatus Nealsonbacteria bacterium]|nr:DUF4962 domain-containing protein [Candidatus Nealsonbacteria bacterium]